MNGIDLPKNVVADNDRHGNTRFYYRIKGRPKIRLRAVPGTNAFDRAVEIAKSGSEATRDRGASAPHGGVSEAILKYCASASFRELSNTTQRRHRRVLEELALKHGTKRISTIERHHVFRMVDALAGKPGTANDFLKIFRRFIGFCIRFGYRKDDPTIGVSPINSKSDGFHTWTEAEIAIYEGAYATGGVARLALDLLLYTAQRRGDVVLIGPANIGGGRLSLQQAKTGAVVDMPIHPQLARSLDCCTTVGKDTFLVTEFGKPFSPNGFGNWFRKRCDEAGLQHCSAHGLRKAASRRLAEAGCTPHQIMAITGHRTLKEVSRYTDAASRSDLADAAMAAFSSGRSTPTHFVYIYRHDSRVIYIGQGVASRPLAHLGRADFPPAHELRIEIIPVGSKDEALALEQNLISAHDDGLLLNRVMYRYDNARPMLIEHQAQ